MFFHLPFKCWCVHVFAATSAWFCLILGFIVKADSVQNTSCDYKCCTKKAEDLKKTGINILWMGLDKCSSK